MERLREQLPAPERLHSSAVTYSPAPARDLFASSWTAPQATRSPDDGLVPASLSRFPDAFGQARISRALTEPRGARVPLQMKCGASCGCASCAAGKKSLFESIGLQKKSVDGAQNANDKAPPEVDAEEVRRRLGSGAPIPAAAVQRFSAAYGHDFSAVRIHTDGALATQIGAKAFTVGRDVVFAPAQYKPGTTDGDRLIAHELAHVVQQAGGAGAVQGSGLSADAYEGEADRAAETVVAGGRISGLSAVGHGVVQKEGLLDKGLALAEAGGDLVVGAGRKVVSAGHSVVRAGVDLAGAAVDTIGSGILELIALASPGLANFLKNPLEYVEAQLLPSIQSWVEGVTGIDLGTLVSDVETAFSGIADTVSGVMSGDEKACLAFAGAVQKVRDLYDLVANSKAMKVLSSILTAVSGAFATLEKALLAPAFDVLRKVAGGIGDVVSTIAKTVGGWIDWVKAQVSGAADYIAKQLGFEGTSGLTDFLKGKAQEAWDKIKKTLAPVATPLKVMAGVFLAFQPATWTYLLFKYGPSIIEAAKWLWAHKNDPNLVTTAREQGHEKLSSILSSVQGFAGAVQGAAQKATSGLAQGVTAVLKFAGDVTGWPILSAAKGLADRLAKALQSLSSSIGAGLSKAGAWVLGVASKIATAIAPIQDILLKLGIAIVNPAAIPVMLAGWAWKKIPDCYKGPIIDLLLDAVIRLLQASKSNSTFGPLWKILQPGVLGFVRQLRRMSTAIKIEATNKIATFMSAGSPQFLLGYVKGMLSGIWDNTGGTLVDIIELGHTLQTFIETKVGEALGIPAEPERKPSVPGPATAHAAPPAEGTHAASSLSQLDESGVTQREITREELDAYRPKEEGALEDASPVDASTIAAETGKLAGDLKPSASTIANNAGNALREYFKSGSTSSFDELAAKLGEAWGAAEKLISAQGAKLAREAVAVLLGKGGDYAVGEKVGWLAGMIVVEVVIALLTAGTGTAAKGAATAAKAAGVAAKPVKWTKRAFDAMLSAFRTAGRWLKDAAKSLEKLAQRAKGALQRVMEAIREAGRSIVEFVERLIGRVRGKHAPHAPHAPHVTTPHPTTPHVTTPHAPKEPHGPAGTRAERDVSVKETGHVESNQLSQKQIDNELQHIADNPHVVEGTPPNRKAKIGEHTWEEQPGGRWCRHSNGVVCTISDRIEGLKQAGVKGDLSKVEKDASLGQEGAVGEIEAMERWQKQGIKGEEIEVLPEIQNSGRKNPDFRLSDDLTELKTRTNPMTENYITDQVSSANKQIKKSGLDANKPKIGIAEQGAQGQLEIQLKQQAAATTTLEDAERQVRHQFRPDLSRSLHRVAIYKDGQLFAEWVRTVDNQIIRRFPP